MDKYERYLKIVLWAKKRYTTKKGILLLSIGGRLWPYARIERAAAVKYLGFETTPYLGR